jgi:hypothetical protein
MTTRMQRTWWARLLPQSKAYRCDQCRRGFVVLFAGRSRRDTEPAPPVLALPKRGGPEARPGGAATPASQPADATGQQGAASPVAATPSNRNREQVLERALKDAEQELSAARERLEKERSLRLQIEDRLAQTMREHAEEIRALHKKITQTAEELRAVRRNLAANE